MNQVPQSIFESKENYELYIKMVDSLPIPLYCRTIDGSIKVGNQAFCRIFCKEKAEIVGHQLIDFLTVEQVEVLSRRDRDVFESSTEQFYEASLLFADGIVHDVIINKACMRMNGDMVTGIVSSIFDVTERRKAEELLHKAEEEKMIANILLQKIRAGIVIVDHDLKIIDSNLGFARMVGEENEELFETIPGLKGADLEMLVPGIISDLFQSVIESGESRLERDIKYQNKLLSVSIMTIHKHKIAGAIIRDLSAPMLERAEIIERARQVNRKNMKTVQQIAYLLGENAAQTEELLNSIIESQKYSDEPNK